MNAPPEGPLVLELRGIRKRFGATQALKGVDFALRSGEVHALLGENGAGKSTLIRIVAGAYAPDEGELRLDGEARRWRGPNDARRHGVATVYQETSLFADLSVLENLYTGRLKTKSFGRADWAGMRDEASRLFERLGLDIPLEARLGDLSKASAQQVEIARALLSESRVLILDEPGSVLTPAEIERLHTLVRDCRGRGTGVIYITHRLEEVMRLADRVTVLRDGALADTAPIAERTPSDMVRAMVGKATELLHPRARQEPGATLLDVSALAQTGAFDPVDFQVRAGEVVALFGLVGQGQAEIIRCVAGLSRPDAGTTTLDGTPLGGSPAAAAAAGLGLVPGDRGRQGIFKLRSIRSNITLQVLPGMQRGPLVDRTAQRRRAEELIKELDVRPPRPELAIGGLSGGNAQKVLLARVLATEPRVLILEEPTTGVDIGAKVEIHRLVDALVAKGVGVLLVSSDVVEVASLADRILVVRKGAIANELPAGLEADEIMQHAFGTAAQPVEQSEVQHAL
jgi:ABC-type sugar transport system ATPase subunit